ncbi:MULTISPECIES: MFS transporter [Rhodococcus]|uniref:MFS transporter n=1 Tax=Rhodococcus TaxID=1827 RepID=UPI000622C349|nr:MULTISPECIES: MFS transporter [Rhodococcus]AKE90746.1 arabinose ABC transporter permease [Rhodococcus aetherivorans]QRI78568.1 MFS transporter [Rhodococcus aetherivorans]QSE57036.1 MFS transporter [Rhodococcus sp. PSBB066]QSE71626.1 MFS transporter [Rhodococcus sp. PSBB049]UGQ43082.1 MFS transporter [Rhodococcus aetherivorans]
MAERAEAAPRLTGRILLTVLGPAIAYAIAAVDPLMLTLNLSTVGRGLDVPADRIGMLAAASTLMVAASVLAVGTLGDRFGLARMLVWALVANIAVGLLSSLAPNYPVLLLMRFLDGLALTALLGLSLALVTASVPAELRSTALGVLMAVDTVLYGITPAVGGWVVETFGWRSLFLVTPPLALLALTLIVRFVDEPPRRAAGGVDVLGVSLFGVALLGLVAGIGAVPDGLTEPRAWVPLSVSVAAAATFVWHERRTPEPALNLSLFGRRAFVLAVLAVLTVNLLAAGLGTVLGQLGDYVLGMSSQAVGLLYLPGTLVIAAASVLAGRMIAAHTARPVLVTGLLVIVLSGLVTAATVAPTMTVAALVVATWTSNLGGFVAGTATADTILSQAETGNTGSIAAVQPAFGMMGYALGPTVYILLLDAFYRREVLEDAETRGISVQEAEQAEHAVTLTMSHSGGPTGYDPNLVQLAHGLTLGVDFTEGVATTMLIVSALPLVVAVLVFFLMPRRPDGAGARTP